MAKATAPRRPTVCLLSWHPLLPFQFRRVLSNEEFRLIERRLDSDRPPSSGSVSFALASVFAVEAHSRARLTENLVADVLAERPKARIVIIAEDFSEPAAFALLRAGTKGILRYAEVEGSLPRVLREVARGGFWVPRSLLSRFVDFTLGQSTPARPSPGHAQLSKREREVFDLLLDNLSNKEIAGRLHVSERTAKFHVSNLLAKYGVKRRADLIVLCLTQPERI